MATVTSDWSAPVVGSVGNTDWWICDPTDPDSKMTVRVERAPVTGDAVDDAEVFRPADRPDPIVVTHDLSLDELQLTFIFRTDNEWRAWRTLRARQATLLLQSDMRGWQWYVYVLRAPWTLAATAERRTRPVYRVDVSLVAQARPPV